MRAMLESLAKISFGVAIGWGGLGVGRYGSEILLETENERQLERIIGREIRFNLTDYGEERTEKVSRFERAYFQARKNWDYFEKQFSLVRSVTIFQFLEGEGFASNLGGEMGIKAEPDTEEMDLTIIHELAHFWHRSPLPHQSEFEKKWENISRKSLVNNTYCNQDPSACDYHPECLPEEVASTVAFVYRLDNYSSTLHGSLPLNTPEFISEFEEKIKLLADYGFFSSREKEKALQELKKDEKTFK